MLVVATRRICRGIALASVLTLQGCGGADVIPEAAAASTPVPLQSGPIHARVAEVSSIEQGVLMVSWLPGSDDPAVAPTLRYEVHVRQSDDAGAGRQAESGDFVVSAQTRKYSVTPSGSGLTPMSARIEGLAAGRPHGAKLLVIDGNGNTVASPVRVVRVAQSSPRAASDAVLIDLDAAQVATLERPDGLMRLSGRARLPEVGSILSSHLNGGFLRRVVEAHAEADGAMTVRTAPVGLGELVRGLDFSSSVALQPLPAPAVGAPSRSDKPATRQTDQHVDAVAAASRHVSLDWPDTGLTLSSSEAGPDPVVTASAGPDAKPATSAADLDISSQQGTVSGAWGAVSMPLLVGVREGQPAHAQHVDIGLYVSDPRLEFCKLRLLDDGAGGRLAETIDQRIWLSTAGVTPGSYVVRLRLYLDRRGEHCNGDDAWGLWSATADLSVTVAVTSSQAFGQQRKTLDFSTAGLRVSNDVDYRFDPELRMEVHMQDAFSLDSARFEVQASSAITQRLSIGADCASVLPVQSRRLIEPRKFTKVFVAAGVPVVIEGWFWLDVELSGQTSGALQASGDLRLALDQIGYGLSYDGRAGAWTTTSSMQPSWQFTVQGSGDASAVVDVALVPQIKVQVYRTPTLRLTLRPELNAQVGLHGHIGTEVNSAMPSGMPSSAGNADDGDAWLTRGQLRGALDAYAYAGLEVFGASIVSFPANALPDDYRTHKRIVLLDLATLADLPALSARVPGDVHPADSRAILIRATAEDWPNPLRRLTPPLGPDSLLPFVAWQAPRVRASNPSGYHWINAPAGASVETNNGRLHTRDWWLVIDQPGVYSVRIGATSVMGPWARQVAGDLALHDSVAGHAIGGAASN